MPGPTELILILFIVLLIFGAGKLPAIGDALGRSIKNFKRAAQGATEIDVTPKKELGKKDQGELVDGDEIDAQVVEHETSRKDS